MLNREQFPEIKSAIDFEFQLQNIQTTILPNGIPLYSINDGVQEVLQFEMVFKAGLWHETQKGAAQATAALFKSGTSSKSSFQINEAFEQYGVSVKAGAGNDWASITVSCLSKHLQRILPLLAELLQDTIFPQQELDIHIQNSLQRLSIQLRKGDFVANRLIDEALFGQEHPYGQYMQAEEISALQQQHLDHHLKSFYNAGNVKFFLAGKYAPDVLDAISRVLGENHWNSSTPVLDANYPLKAATEKKWRVVNDAHSVQGAIRIASDFPLKTHPDFSPMIVLNTLFGGYFGSRLMSNIREEKGYTYGIHSYLYNHLHAGAIMISTEAGKDVAEATVHEVYHEMQLLRDEVVSEDELMLVKNYLLGSILGDLDGSFQIIQRWKNLILNGFTEERFYKNIQIYKHITAEELQVLARKYYQPERFYELIVT